MKKSKKNLWAQCSIRNFDNKIENRTFLFHFYLLASHGQNVKSMFVFSPDSHRNSKLLNHWLDHPKNNLMDIKNVEIPCLVKKRFDCVHSIKIWFVKSYCVYQEAIIWFGSFLAHLKYINLTEFYQILLYAQRLHINVIFHLK